MIETLNIEKKRRNIIFTIILLIITLIIFLLPSSIFNPNLKKSNTPAYKAAVLDVDNSRVEQYGIVKVGQQGLTLKILDGEYKNTELKGTNRLLGKMELDTIYQEGDKVLATVFIKNGEPTSATAVGIYRLDKELLLLLLFALFLVGFAGITGLKALLSFLFSALLIWKIMLPLFLLGVNPIIVAGLITIGLSAVIELLIGDFSEKGLAALLGTVFAIVFTYILSSIFTKSFRISGAVKPFMETLLYSGYSNLDLTKIFIAGIFLAASGAIMDIAMDVATSMEEVHKHNPNLSRKELMYSGFRVGRAVIGTMTTTLFLAYSSNYMGLLLVFMAQGTPLKQMLNINYVSSEILNTVIGSFGLVLTAPFTAIVASFLYKKNK